MITFAFLPKNLFWVVSTLNGGGDIQVLPFTTRMHSSRMRTNHFSGNPGGGLPLGGGCLDGCLPPGGGCLSVTCYAGLEANPPVNRMTHECENITLLQTSLAGSNKKNFELFTLRSIALSPSHFK